jgi:hypothetical protein
MYAIEDVLFSMLPKSRWDNHYCMPFRKSTHGFDDVEKQMTMEELEQSWYKEMQQRSIDSRKSGKYDSSRYHAMNLHRFFTHRTIEFRQHSGTLNARKILKWSAILLQIVNYGMRRYNEQNILSLLNQPMSKKKFAVTMKELNMPRSLVTYMKERIKEHNPEYKDILGSPRKGDWVEIARVYTLIQNADTEEKYRKIIKENKKTYDYIMCHMSSPDPAFLRMEREANRRSRSDDWYIGDVITEVSPRHGISEMISTTTMVLTDAQREQIREMERQRREQHEEDVAQLARSMQSSTEDTQTPTRVSEQF